MKRSSNRLNCFSPPVMLATLTIETLLAIYTVWRYRLNNATRLIVAMLVGLATFQLAEYHVCTSTGAPVPWSRLGFVAITALPPLGVHLMHVLAGKKQRRMVAAVYALMVAFMAFFLVCHVFTGEQCTGNYVIFQFSDWVTGTYSVYYYGLLILGIWLGTIWSNDLQKQGKKTRRQVQSTRGLIVGYFVFLVPVAVANTIRPKTRDGIPSIMCGFAVLLAVIMVTYILPRVGKLRHAKPQQF
ncbi:MAG TPA: hypothetical protein VG604_03920 [Candidatus Saccharimonadales bacterium]|nr:hypothetical protein [Candidatus Saccharimonadales bacterium]